MRFSHVDRKFAAKFARGVRTNAKECFRLRPKGLGHLFESVSIAGAGILSRCHGERSNSLAHRIARDALACPNEFGLRRRASGVVAEPGRRHSALQSRL